LSRLTFLGLQLAEHMGSERGEDGDTDFLPEACGSWEAGGGANVERSIGYWNFVYAAFEWLFLLVFICTVQSFCGPACTPFLHNS
jgi:hypothetical protein